MIKVGIDTIAMYTSRYRLDLATLAAARGIDPDKFNIGLGQQSMSVPPPGEDIVTMAANAAQMALADIDPHSIEMLLFATESGIDQSKAAGIYVHELLGLPARCRVVELKQACYGGTAALQLALPFLREHPDKKVLVIASDIARYGLGTPGESSQGAAACAMILAANPRILAIEPEYGVVTESVMDFWRPNYRQEALVEGKYSSKLYLSMLEKSWQDYSTRAGRTFQEHDLFCYHVPVPRLVEKAHQHLLKVNGVSQDSPIALASQKSIELALRYGRSVGNSYTASLYVSLASLLDLSSDDLTGKRIGFYSYGSGCVAEYFSGVVQAGYRQALLTEQHATLLATRETLTYSDYEAFYQFDYVKDGSEQQIPSYATHAYRLARMEQHKRIYASVAADETRWVRPASVASATTSAATDNNVLRVQAPGKLILSGEHAVLYGQPAIAMAVNRYVTATVTSDARPQILFDLADLAHHSHLNIAALKSLKERIKNKYHRFINGEYTIRDVLQKPFELAQFALSMLTEPLNLHALNGVKIQVQSDLPIGCGMGSSAATILAVMQATAHYLQRPIDKESLFKLALEAENMQHGRSSGLDLRVALEGGCLHVHGNTITSRAVPTFPFYLVNTGTPTSTTGQCVEKVAPLFQSGGLGGEFASVTGAMDAALQSQSLIGMQDAIRDNHQLLVGIGVVPEQVQQFVAAVEASAGAAKVCGSGAVIGQRAGALLVMMPDHQQLTALCERYHYPLMPISGELRGVHAA